MSFIQSISLFIQKDSLNDRGLESGRRDETKRHRRRSLRFKRGVQLQKMIEYPEISFYR